MNQTPIINEHSIETIKKQIEQKNKGLYFANNETVTHIITDMDHHPYTRWYRGVSYYPEPIIMEREAGWRPRRDNCYKLMIPATETETHSCFEPACTTTFPCIPSGNKDTFDNKINNMCIVQYR